MSQETFCVIPWLHRFTNEQGFHQLCCVAVGEGNFLQDARGERLHISQQLTDGQVLNSPTVKTARAQMVRGQWPAACERCKQAEEAGAMSVRQQLNLRFDQGRAPALLEATASDGSLEHPMVRYADIRLGNVCNLTCRMCGPVASRLWAPYYNKLQPKSYRMGENDLTVLGQNNWVKQDWLAWLLEQNLPSVEALHFAGGEPLLVPEMVDALELCIRSGRAGEISLSYNTNITVLPEKVTSLWKYFRGVSLLCSVDGFGKLNEYIRRPSRWSDVDRNLHMLERHFEEWNLWRVAISATVQIYNALNINELYEYIRAAGFTRILAVPQLVPLFNPEYLSIQALPARAKSIVRHRLQTEIDRMEGRDLAELPMLLGTARATLAFMDGADTTSHLRDFFAFCKSSDEAFADSWHNAAPELADHLRTTGWKGLLRRLDFRGKQLAGAP